MANGGADYRRLRVLFLALELEKWTSGRSHTYPVGIGLEEGFRASGVKVTTLNTFCFRRARELCAGKRFDQVWIHIYPTSRLDECTWEWVAGLARVRIGLLVESLQYNATELNWVPWFTQLQAHFNTCKKYLTHIVSCDEKDAEGLVGHEGIRAVWWPGAIPDRFIDRTPRSPNSPIALFAGNPYDERADWLKRPELQGIMLQQPSPEKGTLYPLLFDSLQTNLMRYMNRPWLPCTAVAVRVYFELLRALRRRCFRLWLLGLQKGAVVVNLPHYVKTYSGRVVESMAVGRPVVSWEIPDRPRNKGLFVDEEEILLYSAKEPQQLSQQIRRLLADRVLLDKIIRNATLKVRRFHTQEHRVRQFLDWVTNGDEPVYC